MVPESVLPLVGEILSAAELLWKESGEYWSSGRFMADLPYDDGEEFVI
jgi:hypothetical protein